MQCRNLLFSFTLVFTISYTPNAQCLRLDTSFIKTMPFREDSVTSFTNFLVSDNVVSNLRQSQSQIEIRMYLKSIFGDRGEVYIIRLENGTITAEKLRYQFENPKYKPLLGFYSGCGRPGYRIDYFIINQKPQLEWKKLIEELLSSGILMVSDQGGLVDSLHKSGIRVINPCGKETDCDSQRLISFEVKYNKQERNFRLCGVDFFKFNPTLSVFETRNKILNAIWPFFRKSETKTEINNSTISL